MLLLSHRGHCRAAPENTLEAFQQARQWRVDGFETDVRTSVDGIAILFHDRFAPNGSAVSSLNAAELAQITGHGITTLEDALGAYPDLFWNLEIKSPVALKPALAALDRVRPRGRILITSFFHPVIVECVQRCDYDCGLLIAHYPLDLPALVPAKMIRRLHTVVIDFEVVDARLIDQATNAQLSIFAYGVVSANDHRFISQLNVTGVITDDLEIARAAINRD